MKYTKNQIIKLLIERRMLKHRHQAAREVLAIDAELQESLTSNRRVFIDAAKVVYQENRA